MCYTWPEKLGFHLHRSAYHLIRWSIKRRMRRLGRDTSTLLRAWESMQLQGCGNKVCMECCKEDLHVARQLMHEEKVSEHMRRNAETLDLQPRTNETWVLFEKLYQYTKLLEKEIVRKKGEAPSREQHGMKPHKTNRTRHQQNTTAQPAEVQ